MSPAEYVYAIVAGLSLVGGFVLEWRRGGDFAARLAALEQQDLPVRVATIEAMQDRMRRSM
jgi:hypothetical protein